MDVLESLNGMLIKGLGCGLRCKDHLQLQNVPLEMSVISAQTRQPCSPADAPCSTGLCNLPQTKNKSSFHNPAVRLQNGTVTLCENVMEIDRAKHM